MVRSNNSINPQRILDFVYLLSAYADDTTFFVSDLDSVKAIFVTFDNFSLFSGMKINFSKCELAGIGVKRSVLTALMGVNNVSLLTSCIRILGVNFTYNTWPALKSSRRFFRYGVCAFCIFMGKPLFLSLWLFQKYLYSLYGYCAF